jgi:glycosyltransferase involved in cell wall biosynthesis
VRKLSGVIISYNEEAKIRKALQSLSGVCDEVVVVDSLSTDATVEICRGFTERILEKQWQGYRKQKQYATDQAANDWVLSLDADEELSPELREEILEWKEESSDCDGYFIPRIAYFMGRWIRHTTWYPDWQLRLFRRSCGRWEGGRVHEGFKLRTQSGRLKGHLHHYTYDSVSEYLQQLERFSSLAAEDYSDAGRRAGVHHLLLEPTFVFFKNYVLRLGFLDSTPGLVISLLAANSTLFKYLKLREIQDSESNQE